MEIIQQMVQYYRDIVKQALTGYDATSQEDFKYNIFYNEVDENIVDIENFDGLFSREAAASCTVAGVCLPCVYGNCHNDGSTCIADGSTMMYYVSCSGGTDTTDTTGDYTDTGDDTSSGEEESEGGGGSGVNTENEENSDNPSSTGIFVPYDMQITQCLGPVDDGYDYTTWLFDSNTPRSDIKDMAEYLSENDCSSEAKDFATLVSSEFEEGVEVNYNNRFFYFPDWDDYLCQKDIVVKANSGDYGAIGQTMQLVFTDNSIFNNPSNVYVNYDVEVIPSPSPSLIIGAETKLGFYSSTTETNLFEININFNPDFISQSTDLGIFTAAIHENLHALLAIYLDLEIISVQDDETNLSNLAKIYAERRALILINESNTYDMTSWAYLQHEVISELVGFLSEEIKNYSESKGYVADDEVYNSLAWFGLHTTEEYLSFSFEDREEIEQVIENEITGNELEAYGTKCID